jgi:hypothetical protein
MNESDFRCHLLSANAAGTLLTPKHDPDKLGIIWSKPRSVLSSELAENLESFLKDGNYTVIEYENSGFPHSPMYWEIIPDPESTFTVPGSGVPAYSMEPSTALDRLVAVSGTFQGLHLYAEDSYNIQARVASGGLRLNGQLEKDC